MVTTRPWELERPGLEVDGRLEVIQGGMAMYLVHGRVRA